MTKSTTLIACILSSFLLLACNKDEENQTNSAPEDALTFILKSAPSGAISVGEARKNILPGETVTVTGRVGGTVHPIAEKYASFVLLDSSIIFCSEMGDEHCATPWDACCEDVDNLAAHRTSVLFYDESGQPLAVDLKKQANLTPMDTVTVVGRASENSTPDNLLLVAEGIYISPGQ
tara:strand:+ start:7360 stop:7890 length:531 start_codon:yes stop_codon:yes gene_type:complete